MQNSVLKGNSSSAPTPPTNHSMELEQTNTKASNNNQSPKSTSDILPKELDGLSMAYHQVLDGRFGKKVLIDKIREKMDAMETLEGYGKIPDDWSYNDVAIAVNECTKAYVERWCQETLNNAIIPLEDE